MAQMKYIKDKEQIRQEATEKAKKLAMELWQKYANEYKTLPEKYELLLEEKRQYKLPLKQLSKANLKMYPEIPFLRIASREAAEAEVEALAESGKLRKFVSELELTMETNYTVNALRAWTVDSTYLILKKKYLTAKKVALKSQ